MRSRERASRYAAAYFQWAREADYLQRGEEELGLVERHFQDQSIMGFLRHPLVSRREKKLLLEDMARGLSPNVLNLVKLLADNDHLPLVPLIFAAFKKQALAHAGIKEAEVVSAVELGSPQRQVLKAALEMRFKSKIRLVSRIDRQVVGGFRVRVGDYVLDLSVAAALAAYAESLNQP